jgi:hypothetical protein
MALFFWDANGDEPVYASGLLNGHVGTATDLADMVNYDVSTLPSGIKAYVPNYGIFALDKSSAEPINELNQDYIFDANGGGQWVLISTSASDSSSVEDLIFDYIIDFLGDLPEYIKTQLDYLTTTTASLIASVSTINSEIGALTQTLTATASLDFPSISTGSSQELTVTVTGAAVNDEVTMGLPALSSGLIANAWVSSTNTVTVRLSNISGVSVNPSAQTYRIVVRKYA